jgi:hypothetical protein
MQKLTVGEFKNRFSEVVERVRKGEKIAVQYGKKREIIGMFAPYESEKKKTKRKLGILRGKVDFDPKKFAITEDEFLAG